MAHEPKRIASMLNVESADMTSNSRKCQNRSRMIPR
jgi:hypothetical protein